MTILDLGNLFFETLSPIYSRNEIRSIFHIYVCDKFGMKPQEIYLEGVSRELPLHNTYAEDLSRLASGEPIQYVTGVAEFYGLKLKVNPSVLIPRPETEELVEMVISGNSGREGIRILDIGTGSGAIAISLSLNLPLAEVWAADCSESALQTAEQNAAALGAKVNFFHWNIFDNVPANFPEFDIIVSNPPYIPEREKKSMSTVVTAYEPALALFVPDDDKVMFYSRIAEIADSIVASYGKIYVEIHECYAEETAKALVSKGLCDVDVRKDINGKERIIFCEKK